MKANASCKVAAADGADGRTDAAGAVTTGVVAGAGATDRTESARVADSATTEGAIAGLEVTGAV